MQHQENIWHDWQIDVNEMLMIHYSGNRQSARDVKYYWSSNLNSSCPIIIIIIIIIIIVTGTRKPVDLVYISRYLVSRKPRKQVHLVSMLPGIIIVLSFTQLVPSVTLTGLFDSSSRAHHSSRPYPPPGINMLSCLSLIGFTISTAHRMSSLFANSRSRTWR